MDENPENSHISPTFMAIFIGFLIGIIIYSVAMNAVGFFTLIPLYLIYKWMKKPEKSEDEFSN